MSNGVGCEVIMRFLVCWNVWIYLQRLTIFLKKSSIHLFRTIILKIRNDVLRFVTTNYVAH